MDESIKEMFREKNKEIIQNKLILDFKNNMDSLNKILLNITNLEFEIGMSKLKEYKLDFMLFDKYHKSLVKEINEFILSKTDIISQDIQGIDFNAGDIKIYIDNQEKLSLELENNFMIKLRECFDKFYLQVVSNKLNEDEKYNIDYCLNNRLYRDLLKKFEVQINERDNIIKNNAIESYNKYLELNDNFED